MMTSEMNHGPEVLIGFTIMAIVLSMVFIMGIHRHMGHAADESQPWTVRLRGASTAAIGVAFCVLVLALVTLTIFPGVDWLKFWMSCSFLGTLTVHAALEVTLKIAAPHDHEEQIGTSLKAFMAQAVFSRLSEFRRATTLLKLRLVPNGFRDVQLSKLIRSPFKSEYRALGVLYLLIGVLTVMSVLTLLGTGQNVSAQVVRTWSVFWVLMLAVSMTPPFAFAWLTLKYIALTGAIECKITLRSLTRTVANWVSVGGVAGLVTGTLSFVPLRLLAERGMSQDPIPLSLLADLSLAGAIVGFIGAHFAVLFGSTARMENRLAALTLPVLTVSASATAASLIGINPAANARYALKLIRNSMALPDDLDFEGAAGLDWKALLSATESSMSGAFPGSTTFAIIISGSATFVALLMFGQYVRSSLRAAGEEGRGKLRTLSTRLISVGRR